MAVVCACLLAVPLALTACAGTSTVPAALQKYYQQKLQWQACPPEAAVASGVATLDDASAAVAGFQCAELTVPLNYQDPDGTTIKLALNRLPAADKADRNVSMLTNPGGPGGSGLGYVFTAKKSFTAELRTHYTIVGMDPRGVGLSAPVDCELTRGEAQLSAEEYAAALARACQQTVGGLIPYVGTRNAARDLDIARAVLGEPKLNYLGVSYGTLLGLYYADMFPKNVGRMVLDSVSSPTGRTDPVIRQTATEEAFDFMVETCVDQGNCPMGNTVNAALANFGRLLTHLESSSVTLGGEPITASGLLSDINDYLYNEGSWPDLWLFLGQLIHGTGSATYSAADAAADSMLLGEGNLSPQAFTAIYCLTLPEDQRTVATAKRQIAELHEAAPYFGRLLAQGLLNCAKWPVPSPDMAGQPIHAPGTPTILVVSNSVDPVTPVSQAEVVHEDLPDSALVVNEAGGHGFYGMGSCTDAVVDDFLIDGTKPAQGTTCADRHPKLLAS